MNFQEKIVERANLRDALTRLPRPWVLTNGCFDLLHVGHVTYLQEARALGASLIVGLNTDASVKRLNKGPERPINTLAARSGVIAALASVSLVTEFDEDTALALVQIVRPDIYVKGGDWSMSAIPEGRFVTDYGGRAVAVPVVDGFSTTKLVQQMKATAHTDVLGAKMSLS